MMEIDKPVQAAYDAIRDEPDAFQAAVAAVEAAEPIIRADVIAEVVVKIRCGMGDPKCPWQEAADFIERAFGSKPEPTYQIVRFFRDKEPPDHREVIDTGLTLEEVQTHCQRDDTRGPVDEERGVEWFDGYERED